MSTEQAEIEQLKSRMLMKSYYVMFRRIVDRAKLAPAVLLAHYQWIIALEKQGHVFASGPLFDAGDAPGVGMTVFRAKDFDEAGAFAAGDPFCVCGAATYEIKRWQLNEGRLQISIDLSDRSFQLL
jgi:uncharacterized protein